MHVEPFGPLWSGVKHTPTRTTTLSAWEGAAPGSSIELRLATPDRDDHDGDIRGTLMLSRHALSSNMTADCRTLECAGNVVYNSLALISLI